MCHTASSLFPGESGVSAGAQTGVPQAENHVGKQGGLCALGAPPALSSLGPGGKKPHSSRELKARGSIQRWAHSSQRGEVTGTEASAAFPELQEFENHPLK